MKKEDIAVGRTYTSTRWKGDRKVTGIKQANRQSIVHFIDNRTLRTGHCPLEVFAKSAQGPGLVSNL